MMIALPTDIEQITQQIQQARESVRIAAQSVGNLVVLKAPLAPAQYADLGVIQREAYDHVAAERGWPVRPVIPDAGTGASDGRGTTRRFPVDRSGTAFPFVRIDTSKRPVQSAAVLSSAVTSAAQANVRKLQPERPRFRSIRTSSVRIFDQDHAVRQIDDLLESACLGLLGAKGKPW